MFKKIAALATAAVLCTGLMAGCGASSTTADTSYSAENPLVLTLAHGLSETHTVHIAMTQFAEEVNEKTDGRVQVKIFPNGQLGSENENLEQLQAGVIAMTKVSAPGLATYKEAYNAFGLPYIFNDTEDFYHVMDSQQMQDFFLSTGDDGFVTLTYYTSGARSFYTKDKAIRTPADLKGLKIRVQNNAMMVDMVNVLGGTGVTGIGPNEVYSAITQGTIDGAENNWPTYQNMGDYEAAPYFVLDEHTRVPEILLASAAVLSELDPADVEIIKQCAKETQEFEKEKWAEKEAEAEQIVRDHGCTITELDADAYAEFQAAMTEPSDVLGGQSLYEKYGDEYQDIIDAITAVGEDY